MKVLIFGFGVHGGGYAAASYFLARGHEVRITDQRDSIALGTEPSLLAEKGAELSLGGHKEEDVLWADIVVKNPAVPTSHPLLRKAKKITNDLAWLLTSPFIKDRHIIAVTGTKGKTTTASAIAHILQATGHTAQLCGNMGISGFSILDEWEKATSNNIALPEYLVCEFSSWQIRDTAQALAPAGFPTFDIAVMTSFFPDHLNTYSGLESYRKDKLTLFGAHCTAVLGPENMRKTFLTELKLPSGRIKTMEKLSVSMSNDLQQFLRAAYAAARVLKIPASRINDALHTFKGVSHRQEIIGTVGNIVFVNDSAATIPEAVTFTYSSFSNMTVHLICGGTDKNLEAASLTEPFKQAQSIILLDGSFTREKILPLLRKLGLPYHGPFTTMKEAITTAWQQARNISTASTITQLILLSPGAASFELFKHEFDRGDQFRSEAQLLMEKSTYGINQE